MTRFARRILAVLAILAVSTVQYAAAQQAFVSDIEPTSYQAAPRQAQSRESWEANNYRVARRTQMEAELVQPKPVLAAPAAAPSGWGDEGPATSSSSEGNCGCSESGNCGCGDSCNCSPCGRCGSRCGSRCCGGCYIGASLVWAKPFFQHNTAYTSVDTISNGVTDAFFAAQEFEYDYETTPRVWIGYENSCGLGIRSRFWQFDQSANEVLFEDTGTTAQVALPEILDVTVGNAGIISTDPGDTLTETSRLKVQAVDLEATQRFRLGRTDIVGSLGGRYARLEQDLFATIIDANSAPVAALFRTQDFEGAGFTAGLDVRRPICCCCGNLALVGSARGSILFGQRNVDAAQLVIDDGTSIVAFTRTEDEIMGVGEIEAGIEWSYCCSGGRRFYVQGNAEGQLWEGAGNASDADSNLGFLGFGFTVGVAR